MELKFNIPQSFSGIEQRSSTNNCCLNYRLYWWTSTFLRSKSGFVKSLNGTKIWNQIEIPIWTIQVRRWIVQIAILDWFSPWCNEKSKFGSQNPDVDWSKGTEPKTVTYFNRLRLSTRKRFNDRNTIASLTRHALYSVTKNLRRCECLNNQKNSSNLAWKV